jgi:Hypothetical glycosyl hydrolase family 15
MLRLSITVLSASVGLAVAACSSGSNQNQEADGGGSSDSASGSSGSSGSGSSSGAGSSSGTSGSSGSSGSSGGSGASDGGRDGGGASSSGGGDAGASFDPPYPRLGGYPIGSPQNYGDPAFLTVAPKYHVVIVSNWPGFSNAGMTMAQVFQAIKKASASGTKLFSYVNINETESYQEQTLLDEVSSEKWYLYPQGTGGTPVPSAYAGATEVNSTTFTKPDANGKNWVEWYDDYRYGNYVAGDSSDGANPYGDGFFTDNVFWMPAVDGDWNLDGTTDSQTDPTVQGWYRAGYQAHFAYLQKIWPGSMQLGNVAEWGQSNSTLGVYDQMIPGGVLEGYLGDTWSFETWGGFAVMMAAYEKTMDALAPPKLGIVGDDQALTDYQGMRYGLAATLMDDGYYYHSAGGAYSYQLAWYDEFDSNLGHPLSTAQGARQTGPWQQGVWRRDFDNGVVLVNPKGNGSQTVSLGGTFTKLKGTQDPTVNDGSTVTSVTLADRDGIILKR